ncbi:MAG: Na+/H+ antiporter subunit E [Bacteroidales bacterium]|nr:Na+/H+ antiporter subunit E [Bacteroidales bacterium]
MLLSIRWGFHYCTIKSNIDVIFRVLSPSLPMRPGIVRVETKLKKPDCKDDPCQFYYSYT